MRLNTLAAWATALSLALGPSGGICTGMSPEDTAGQTLRLRVLEGAGASIPLQAYSRARFVVVVEELSGRPAAGALVSFRLPSRGTTATFPSGMHTEEIQTGSDGKATISGLRGDGLAGPLTIHVEAKLGEQHAEINIDANVTAQAIGPQALAELPAARKPPVSKKWIIVAVAVGGGAAAAFAFHGGGSTALATGLIEPAIVIPTVGVPTVTVTHP
jgi:hypothetical protein